MAFMVPASRTLGTYPSIIARCGTTGACDLIQGTIAIGTDADRVALDATGSAQTVIIQDEVQVRDGVAIRRCTLET
jgi:hypothetical protein